MSYSLYPAILSLADGTLYKGWSFFQLDYCFGEVVFNTGMTGYQEVLSDPSYSGQMVVFTYPELGNTGLNHEDNESNFIHAKSVIAKNISCITSNWRSKLSLPDYIILKKIPHIFGIDTRALTRYIASFGVTHACLSNVINYKSTISTKSKSLDYVDLCRKVINSSKYCLIHNKYSLPKLFSSKSLPVFNTTMSSSGYTIVLLDFGVKFNILRSLISLKCNVDVLPITSTYDQILECKPDGILLSNGPGNPLTSKYSIDLVKSLVNFSNVPIFGICMGHQILNLALGSKTFKLKFGHRGLNHPSGNHNYSEITSQNHGFAVDYDSLFTDKVLYPFNIKYLNLNDLTVALTCHQALPIFSVQYHPEASPGPHDSRYLFDVFIELIRIVKDID